MAGAGWRSARGSSDRGSAAVDWRACPLDVVKRNVKEDMEFIAELFEQGKIGRVHLLARRTDMQGLGYELRQGNDAGIPRGPLRPESGLPVRELLNPVHDAHGHLPAADGAEIVMMDRLLGREAHAAVPVAVVVVLPLFRKELYGAEKAPASPDGVPHRGIGYVRVETVRLAPDLRGRVGVGIGNKRDFVERRKTPVHRRVGRQPGLDEIG